LEFFSQFGLLGLFLSSFLAATILPLGSELVLSALLVNGVFPSLVVFIATLGNVLGALTCYALGYYARWKLLVRWFGVSLDHFSAAEQRLQRLGPWALCFTWVPIIGDPIAVAAGALRVRFELFLILVTLSKGLRYIVVSYLVLSIQGAV